MTGKHAGKMIGEAEQQQQQTFIFDQQMLFRNAITVRRQSAAVFAINCRRKYQTAIKSPAFGARKKCERPRSICAGIIYRKFER